MPSGPRRYKKIENLRVAAWKASVPFSLGRKWIRDAYERATHCEMCGVEFGTGKTRKECDRIVPDSGYVEENIAFVCGRCNRRKDNHDAESVARLAVFLQRNGVDVFSALLEIIRREPTS